MAKITIKISNGTITASVDGVKGASCKDLTKPLEDALGVVTKDELKGEYYEQSHIQTENQ